MKLLFPLLMSLLPMAAIAQSAPLPKTTEAMVIATAKQGVTPDQIMNVMPAEIRATVKLYLDGKIRQWYSRSDGRGVDEAHAVMDTMPPSKEKSDGP